jgi:hypothetical protein
VTIVIVTVPLLLLTVNVVPPAPVKVTLCPLAGTERPTDVNEVDTALAATVTVRVVVVTPLVVEVVVVTAGPEPPIRIAVSPLIAAGCVDAEPATLAPLD